MLESHQLFGIALMALVLAAAYWDLRQRRIPNALVLVGAIVGLLLQAALEGPSGVLVASLGVVVGISIFIPGYLLGFTGAGDAKLMASIGAFLGPLGVFQVGVLSILAGGIFGLLLFAYGLLSRGAILPWSRYTLMARTFYFTGRPLYIAPKDGEVMGRKFPFAVSIAIGTTGWMIWQWPLG